MDSTQCSIQVVPVAPFVFMSSSKQSVTVNCQKEVFSSFVNNTINKRVQEGYHDCFYGHLLLSCLISVDFPLYVKLFYFCAFPSVPCGYATECS